MMVIALDSNVYKDRPDNGVDFTLAPAQQAEPLAWFKAELEKPRTAPSLLVLGHHPIFSNGPHGDHKIAESARIIAATGLHLDVPVLSRDGRIRAANFKTIW